MNILILCRHDERPDYDQIDTYRAALDSQPRVAKYEYGELESLVFTYDGAKLSVTSNDKDIAEYDAVFFIGWFKSKILEDIALSAATYVDFHGLKVWNSEVLYTRSRSKLSQYVMAALSEVSLTPFMFCKNVSVFSDALKDWAGGYPVIAKGVQASRGNDNYKIDDEEALKNILALSDDDDGPWFVLQSFVPNNGDYRVVVMGDDVTLVIHRITGDVDSHLNNTSKGGTATVVPVDQLPSDVQQQCVRLAKRMRREITGVDMIRHSETGEFFLLEINNMPQLATGSMVENKMQQLDKYLSTKND